MGSHNDGANEISQGVTRIKTRRTRITVQTSRTIVLGERARDQSCQACGLAAPMIRIEDAAVLFRISSLAIYKLVEAGAVHCAEPADGTLLICTASLNSATIKRV